MGTAFPDYARDIGLGVAMTLHKFVIASRFLDSIQICPLDILDNRDLKRLIVVRRHRYDWHLVQTGWAARQRRSPAMIS